MAFDDKFVERVQNALFSKEKPQKVEEPAQPKGPNYRLKLLNKKVINDINNIQKDKKSFIVQDKENNTGNDEKAKDIGLETNIKARIEKLKAFKKYFMKTENDERDNKMVRRKKSTDLNTFR